MSVTATTNKVQYAAAGTTGPFAFNYPVRDQTELDVYVTVDATGVQTLQTITTHYTVTVNDDYSGASVTFVSSVAAGNTITINRNPALTNENTYNIYDGTFPTVIEEDIDRTSMQDQYLQEQITRSLKAQISDDLDATLPPLVGNDGKYIELVDDGDGTFSLTLSASTVTDGVTNAGPETDNTVARFDGTTGQVIQGSGVVIDDSDNITGVTSIDIGGTIAVTGVLDEDTMSSNSAVKLATQQSIKAYVDTQVATVPTGDVVGPASSTDNALVRFDLDTGKLLQNSNATLSDAGALDIELGITAGEDSFDAALSSWDISDGVKHAKNGLSRFTSYGDSSVTGVYAAAAFTAIDENGTADERILYFGIGGTTAFTYTGGIGAGDDDGGVRYLIGFDLDSAGNDVIYMENDLVCTSGITVSSGNLTLTSGTATIGGGSLTVNGASSGGVTINGTTPRLTLDDTGGGLGSATFQYVGSSNQIQIKTTLSGGSLVLATDTGTTALSISSSQHVTIPTGNLTLTAGDLIISTTGSPASADAGTAGTIAWDASYLYVCTASGAWKRVALTGGY